MVDRVYQRNATAAPPAVPDAPSEGYPTNGNPAGAIPATIPGAYWYHMITESLRNVIVAAGLDPDHEDLGQLVEALQSMGLGGYASAVDAQALSSLTKLLTPGTLDAAFRGGNQSLTINGYQRLPGGLIVQVMQRSMEYSTGFINFPLPIPFPNEALSAACLDIGTSETSLVAWKGNFPDAASMNIRWENVLGSGEVTKLCYVIVLGR